MDLSFTGKLTLPSSLYAWLFLGNKWRMPWTIHKNVSKVNATWYDVLSFLGWSVGLLNPLCSSFSFVWIHCTHIYIYIYTVYTYYPTGPSYKRHFPGWNHFVSRPTKSPQVRLLLEDSLLAFRWASLGRNWASYLGNQKSSRRIKEGASVPQWDIRWVTTRVFSMRTNVIISLRSNRYLWQIPKLRINIAGSKK